ncbi:MAG: helix-turn-helix transcriptional regulator [Erysipelotrichaceae bacterium]|nr:helix-turn-helix transcriptional regulator [Erysipelotrichaceae bacterium]
MNKLGEKIQNLRKKRKITQETLGRAMNIDRSVISRWENDMSYPNEDQIRMLCDYFSVDESYFVLDDDQQEKIYEKINEKEKRMVSMLTIVIIGIVSLLVSPFGAITYPFLFYFSIKQKLPFIINLFLVLLVANFVIEMLYINGIYVIPPIVSIF